MSWSLLSSPHLSSGDLVTQHPPEMGHFNQTKSWAGAGLGWAGDGGLFANNGAQLSVMLHFSFVFCHQHRLAFCLPCSGLAVPSDICHIYPISTLH